MLRWSVHFCKSCLQQVLVQYSSQLTPRVSRFYREFVVSASQIKVRVFVTDSRCDTPELASIAVINCLCLSVFFAGATANLVLIFSANRTPQSKMWPLSVLSVSHFSYDNVWCSLSHLCCCFWKMAIWHLSFFALVLELQYSSQLTPLVIAVLSQETHMKLVPTCGCGSSTRSSNRERVVEDYNNTCVAVGIYV